MPHKHKRIIISTVLSFERRLTHASTLHSQWNDMRSWHLELLMADKMKGQNSSPLPFRFWKQTMLSLCDFTHIKLDSEVKPKTISQEMKHRIFHRKLSISHVWARMQRQSQHVFMEGRMMTYACLKKREMCLLFVVVFAATPMYFWGIGALKQRGKVDIDSKHNCVPLSEM